MFVDGKRSNDKVIIKININFNITLNFIKLRVNLNIVLHRLPCDILSIDV